MSRRGTDGLHDAKGRNDGSGQWTLFIRIGWEAEEGDGCCKGPLCAHCGRLGPDGSFP